MPAEINIAASVQGELQVKALADELRRLKEEALSYGMAKKIMTANTRIEIEQMKQSNTMLKAKANMNKSEMTQLAKQNVLQEQYTEKFNHRMKVEMEAFKINEANKAAGMSSDIRAARVQAEAQISMKERLDATTASLYQQRKALMSASISLFVLNISVSQLVSSLRPLFKENEEATKALREYQAVLSLSLGPIQAYMALKMIQIALEKQHAAAVVGVVAGMSAAYFWYAALTSKSRELRVVMGALAGIMTVIALRQAWTAITAWQAAVAEATLQSVSTLGAAAPAAYGMLAAGLAMAAGVGAAIGGLTAPKGQVLTGHSKKVRKGGLAELDDDEVVQRVSKDGTKGGGGDTIIVLPDSYTGSMSDAKITAHSVRRLQNSGYGTVKYQRRSVGG